MPEQSPLDLAEGDPFGPHNLPYGVFSTAERARTAAGSASASATMCSTRERRRTRSAPPTPPCWRSPTLNPLLAAGRTAWRDVRRALTAWVTVPAHRRGHRAAAAPARRGDAAPAVRGRRLRRLLRERAPRHERRQDLPPGRRRADPQLEAPADRLPRPGRHGRRLRHGRRPPLRASARPPPTRPPSSARPCKLDIEAEVGFVVGAPSELGTPGRRSATSATTSSASACSTTGRRATSRPGSTCRSARSSASPSPPPSRAWVTPLEALDAARDRPARPGLPAAALPGRRGRRGARRLRPAHHRRDQRPGGLRAAVLHHVLDGRPAAGPYDGQRRLAAHGRPVRLRHGQRPRGRTSAAPCWSSPGTAATRSNSPTASGRSWRTATW